MAITISGTTVTYNDSSTTTTNTPNATAALGAGALGSYAQLRYPGNTAARSEGFTIAGSSLRFTSGDQDTLSGSTPSGSWRLMGYLGSYTIPGGKAPPTTGYALTSVWLRYA
jgi:hypothetical protein